jgi:hypothetical protein
MSSIRKIHKGFHVKIRKKGCEYLSATFSDRETAELWGKYKEDLIDNIKAFGVPLKDMITLENAIELKVRSLLEENKKKSITNDFSSLPFIFRDFLELPLSELKYEELLKFMLDMSNSKVKLGGAGKGSDTGISQNISPVTVLKRISAISTVINFAIEKGINIENVAYNVLKFMRSTMKKKGKNDKDR